jgi:hypothetical protein
VTDREALKAMLGHARAEWESKGWASLYVREGQRSVVIHTGPDDAVATFTFDVAGTLVTVSVAENGPGGDPA